ncbi:MAG: hypothetical protein FJ091_21470 [Deltaproteobacteria bacterium]|nr:hypothetical protein [Deltaproteobacteria bacterium]
MSRYSQALCRHLANYKRTRLGVRENGVWAKNQRAYPHILPKALYPLNLIESVRSEGLAYFAAHPELKLHRDFHHLNSSQAFALNLVLPFMTRQVEDASALFGALGESRAVERIQPEWIPDPAEGTNVDLTWWNDAGAATCCEVKLTESEFGSVKRTPRYEQRLESPYRARLKRFVDPKFLQPDEFCAHYQLLRNVALLSRSDVRAIVFLLPRANDSLQAPLERLQNALLPPALDRVRVHFVEDVLARVETAEKQSARVRLHFAAVREKYLVTEGTIGGA